MLAQRLSQEDRPKARQTQSEPAIASSSPPSNSCYYSSYEIFRNTETQAPPQAELIKSACEHDPRGFLHPV